ncbi:molybdenum metabolism regulator [Sulfuricurvum sp.]|uniref:molybdenum metabolism regulator n=1 Tax=Sulfuricurvum sp. TaxID=2025608 RepID=UPI002E2F6D72|nr:molybdenum metabolism regulator [Sulfuricurvum sp.]HEX5328924.1 molybdenum metabolism regulator [Sulfuricurvum sp.]
MQTTLSRAVNNRLRYYRIELIDNLFGESLFIRTYGSLLRSRAKRTITEVYSNRFDAYRAYEKLLEL